MENSRWWYKQQRIIQYNLQMKDTSLMDAAKIARETEEMGGSAVVLNVADSVVWYKTAVHFHKINEFLPENKDILEELIDELHKRNIKVVARGAFFCFEEETYYQKPQWARRNQDGSPVMMGNDRPGQWYTLYQACPNGGFGIEGVGLEVTQEAFAKYDLDGAFWMGGTSGMGCCWCDNCKKKYFERYGKPMPNDASQIEQDWLAASGAEGAINFKNAVLKLKPDITYMRYYWPFDLDIGLEFKMPADNIDLVSKEGNTLCTEAQDVLSLGIKNLPEWNTPALRMKMGRTVGSFPPPVGIIHTCPGMDWRHICIPEAEFLYWAAQIPANGGSYWTTFTGFADTIPDKRMLKTIAKFNKMTEKVVDEMENAKGVCSVMLLSDGGVYVQGWAEALMCAHIDFDMLAHYQLSYDRIEKYPVVIIPKDFKYPSDSTMIFEKYVENGGKLIVEGTEELSLRPVEALLGIKASVVCSEDLAATYLRIEASDSSIQEKVGDCELIPLRGKVGFCEPKEGAKILATWVPSFAPVKYAGMPPERATLPAPKTNIPLCIVSEYKKGKVMFLPYEPSRLIREYGLQDMFTMIEGYVEYMLGDDKKVCIDAPNRVMVTAFSKENTLMYHFVNGIGQRPLQDNIPCFNLTLTLKLDGKKVKSVISKIAAADIEYSVADDLLTVKLSRLDIWDMLVVELD